MVPPWMTVPPHPSHCDLWVHQSGLPTLEESTDHASVLQPVVRGWTLSAGSFEETRAPGPDHELLELYQGAMRDLPGWGPAEFHRARKWKDHDQFLDSKGSHHLFRVSSWPLLGKCKTTLM